MNIDGFTVHPDVTLNAISEAVIRHQTSLDDPGFCVACGVEYESGIEPDAERYECEACGEEAVYGAEELLLRLVS